MEISTTVEEIDYEDDEDMYGHLIFAHANFRDFLKIAKLKCREKCNKVVKKIHHLRVHSGSCFLAVGTKKLSYPARKCFPRTK